ncbi:Myosin heavy chain, striated muscle [Phytophthora cinnamomi]|uniref:Myosin heavy chain, striated muscle n=1 Tax=Phytophthora cinnamomi TaxID=4785 RepID=UPI00355A291B|nr:Myosin heavy chain, striated muscle [Phytophthora cinnamomi]
MSKVGAGSEPAHHLDQDDLAEEGQIDDDGGFVDDGEDEPGEDHGDKEAEDADDEEEEEEGEDTSGTGGTNDDEAEGEESAQITNELLEAQTLLAVAQSRSAERRRQHASPRHGPVISVSGGPPDDDPVDDEGSGVNPDPGSRGPNPVPANRGCPFRNPLAPVAPFGPEAQCVPGRGQPRILIQADVDPWISDGLDNKTLAAMRIQALFPVLPIHPG